MKTNFNKSYLNANWFIICALVASFLLITCQKEKQTSSSFYHWKTEFSPTQFENKILDSLKVKHIYAKFFDVDWDNSALEAMPSALIQNLNANNSQSIIPTIFITNRTFSKIAEDNIPKLATQVYQLINQLSPQFQNLARETQFDCDWTQSTRDKYFEFLSTYQKLSLQPISATIRLHQIKYSGQTGIPPVAKGTLMFYNMGEVDQLTTSNSIIDLQIADQYLNNLNTYPLPLSIALPIYRWGVVFRGGKFVQLINDLGTEELADSSLTESINAQYFIIKKNGYLSGHYFYEDDVIRLEDSPPKIVKQSVDLLASKIEQNELEVIYYHLDSMNLQRYFKNKHGF